MLTSSSHERALASYGVHSPKDWVLAVSAMGRGHNRPGIDKTLYLRAPL